MRITYLVRFWAVAVVALAANCAWAGEVSLFTPLGNNTYSFTVKAQSKFTRNTEKLKDQAMDVAEKFCAKEGKQLKVISVAEDKSVLLVGPFAQITMTFKALDPQGPEVASPTPALAMPPPSVSKASPEIEMLYADMLRLEDLHKRGLLNDAEFERERQKVLARSK
jgi:hypothetical protein